MMHAAEIVIRHHGLLDVDAEPFGPSTEYAQVRMPGKRPTAMAHARLLVPVARACLGLNHKEMNR